MTPTFWLPSILTINVFLLVRLIRRNRRNENFKNWNLISLAQNLFKQKQATYRVTRLNLVYIISTKQHNGCVTMTVIVHAIYVGQLIPSRGIPGHTLSQFTQIWRVFTPCLIWPNLAHNKVPNKRTLKYQKLTKNPIPKLESDRYIYPKFYIDFTP